MGTAREVVTIDDLPVEVSSSRWAKEPDKVAAEVRAKRRADDPPEGDTGERPTSFDDVTREHGEP